VVLVNVVRGRRRRSSPAPEDQHRAKLMGRTTFGRLGATIIPLSDDRAVNLTTSLYLHTIRLVHQSPAHAPDIGVVARS